LTASIRHLGAGHRWISLHFYSIRREDETPRNRGPPSREAGERMRRRAPASRTERSPG